MSLIAAEMAERVFGDHAEAARREVDGGVWPQTLWNRVAEAGLALALVPEDAGGPGLPPLEALAPVRVAGAFAAPVPLADTMLANWLLASAGQPVDEAPRAVAMANGLSLVPADGGWRVRGPLGPVPWARHARQVIAPVEEGSKTHLVMLDPTRLELQHGVDLAGEPRDTAHVDLALAADAVATSAVSGEAATACGAILRSLAIAGALETVLALTVEYAGQRVQFGRPIGKFQAIQHHLAVMAGEVAAARAAADLAAETFAGAPVLLHAAAAKARAGEAVQSVAALAHQVHGAIGFTREHALHRFTCRVWTWRDDHGGERVWSRRLGQAALAHVPGTFWAFVTADAQPAEAL